MGIFRYEYHTSTAFSRVSREDIPARAIWDGLKQQTTAHGFPNMVNARGAFKKAFWSSMCVIILGAVIFHLVDIFKNYFRYKVNVNIEIKTYREMRFPAVTVCNANPVKKSALEKSSGELAEIVFGSQPQVQKLRKKRSLGLFCTNTSQIHTESGLCVGIGTANDLPVRYDGTGGAAHICHEDLHGGVFIPNTQSKWDFIRNSPIFEGVASSRYWIGIKIEKWYEDAPMDMSLFHKYAAGFPDSGDGNCVSANISDGHMWKNSRCSHSTELYLPLCQQLVQCPWPAYADNSVSPPLYTCYFFADPSLLLRYKTAKLMCENYDWDATLAVVDTLDKYNHLLSTGAFADITENAYWVYLKDMKWEESYDATWTHWNPIESSDSDCAMAHIDDQHQWTDEECDNGGALALALCQWTDTAMPVVTNQPHTTGISTTDSPSSAAGTTDPPLTSPPTTPLPSSAAATTDPSSTTAPTTEPPPLAAATTSAPTSAPTSAQTTVWPSSMADLTSSVTTTESTSTSPETTTEAIQTVSTAPTSMTDAPTDVPSTAAPSTEMTPSPIGFSTDNRFTPCSSYTIVSPTGPPSVKTTSDIQPTAAPTSVLRLSTSEQVTEGKITTPETQTPTTIPQLTHPAVHHTSIPGSKYPERIQVRKEFQIQEKAIEVLSEMSTENKSKLGFSSEEFLLDCQYNGYICSPHRDFTTFYNGLHGNCYTYNSGWNLSHGLMKADKPGRRYGLKLVVNVGQDEYIKTFGEEAGVRVVIHSQDTMPFPEDEGIFAKPGFLTTIGVRKVAISRMSSPYGTCIRQDPSHIKYLQNVYQELYPIKYSKIGCLKTCYQRHVISECGCGDPHYPLSGAAFSGKVSACDPNNITQDDCKYSVTRRYMRNKLLCDCPSNCDDELFLPSPSVARWPSDVQADYIVRAFKGRAPSLFDQPNDPMKYRRNLIKLEIYYEDIILEEITERPAYEGFRFMSDIGGTLSLSLGFSLITTVEFIEFAVDILLFALLRIRGALTFKRGMPSDDEMEEPHGGINLEHVPLEERRPDSCKSLPAATIHNFPGSSLTPYVHSSDHSSELPAVEQI